MLHHSPRLVCGMGCWTQVAVPGRVALGGIAQMAVFPFVTSSSIVGARRGSAGPRLGEVASIY